MPVTLGACAGGAPPICVQISLLGLLGFPGLNEYSSILQFKQRVWSLYVDVKGMTNRFKDF